MKVSYACCLHPRISDEEELTWNHETVANEIAHCRALLSEVDCKIAKLTLARLLMGYDAMLSKKSTTASGSIHAEEVLLLYRDLIKLDQPHSQYYEDEYSLVLLKKVIAPFSRAAGGKHNVHYDLLSKS